MEGALHDRPDAAAFQGRTLGAVSVHSLGMWNLPDDVPIPTIPVDQPYLVRLDDRFQGLVVVGDQ